MKEVIDIPFNKIHNEQIEFHIIDMKMLYETKIEHDLEYPHRLKFNSIMLVIDGIGTHSIDFTTYNYTKGTVFFVKKGQVNAFVLNPNFKCYFLQFSDDFLNRLVQNNVYEIFDYMRYSVKMQLDSKTYKDVLLNISLLKNQLQIPIDTFKEPILQSLFNSLLLQLKRKREELTLGLKNNDQKTYQAFLEMVHSSHTYKVKVEDYAKKLNISTRTLSNLLHKYTKKSTKTYLNEFLLLEIKRYLLNENITIQKISDLLEFDEPTNMIKFFKKLEDKTPIDFKNNCINVC